MAQGLSPSATIGTTVSDFQLKAVDAKEYSLNADPDARGYIIVFSCNHCPFAKLYTERLNTLHRRFAAKHVPLLVINPMDTTMYEEEGLANMIARAREAHFEFPYLIDPSQSVARSFHAQHTPQAYVIWKENGAWVIRYAGAIDNNGEHPELATPFVADAVEALLANRKPAQHHTQSLGCRITYRKQR